LAKAGSAGGLVVHGIGKQTANGPCCAMLAESSARRSRKLLGPNGAGKTTCFYVITGLIEANAGTILLDGVDVTDLPMHRRARLGIGYLPQEASIFRGLSVGKYPARRSSTAMPRTGRRA
jgi:lipopolysaccharide export system ATP-binding protein